MLPSFTVVLMLLPAGEELSDLKSVLLPSLVCSMVHLGDLESLTELQNRHSWDLSSACDYTQTTPLHVAASMGKVVVVR